MCIVLLVSGKCFQSANLHKKCYLKQKAKGKSVLLSMPIVAFDFAACRKQQNAGQCSAGNWCTQKKCLSLQKNRHIMKSHILTKFLSCAAIVAAGFLFTQYASAQEAKERGLQSITQAQAENYVGFLADDLLEGRDAGMRGGKIAARYIVSLLREWGIASFYAGGYYQPFDAAMVTKPDRGAWEVHPDSIRKIKARGAHRLRHMNNILATIPGKRANEYVIIGAHYDHEGILEDVADDNLYNGADDNASGVSAVLQIAKAFKVAGVQPERTVIFAFWDGEEKGLLGSQHFVLNWKDHSQIKSYLNFDMVGRGPLDAPRLVRYFYTASHPAIGKWLEDDMKTYRFDFDPSYRPWDNPVGGSDNGTFARVGVPIIWYHTEGHPDYTRPSDTADKIDFPKLTDITRAAFLTGWHMANEKTY